ncbi:MAG: hypothetical protein A2X35_03730 [Elusimicrobia bacterium GWA2_61_42]|nr:MAG: hypothetical protein A2X35_03730 [Elusimicrobia bacterium GWA2_61_42]OGR77690.1 MAG: hypothetical protein A2X38_09970 [Elusimicrobia bacterium GWC2_61_25]
MQNRKGVTLIELMVATVVISVGVLGMVGSFNYINRAIQGPKGKSLANNLAQEKIEVLKNKSYFRVLVSTGIAEDENFTPKYEYDTWPNGSETLNVGGINFTRRVMIQKVSEDSAGKLKYFNWNTPDTGLKEIAVFVTWQEGSSWRKVELRNLVGNPNRTNLTASFYGTVLEAGTGTPIEGAIIRAQENPARYDTTDAAGSYDFAAEPGQYTLQATRPGYFPSVSQLYTLVTTQEHDFTLTRMSSGTVNGSAWVRDHLVISRIVGSSVNDSGYYQEYVELYNPTTWTWTVNGDIGLKFQKAGGSKAAIGVDLYVRDAIPSQGYYLFANTGTVRAVGANVDADATWDEDVILVVEDGGGEGAGALELYRISDGRILDQVGWDRNNEGKTAPFYETNGYDQDIGLQLGETYLRHPSALGANSAYGPAYDTNNNNTDIEGVTSAGIWNPPHNSLSAAKPVLTGTPAAGAVVFANDSLSASTRAAASGSFSLPGVATGYWSLYVSSGISLSTGGFYGGGAAGFSASAGDITLSSANVFGYISGVVTGVDGAGLPSIKVAAGGRQTATLASGAYLLPADPGEQTVMANYQNDDSNYIETSSNGVNAVIGDITPGVDFVLLAGGKLRGWVTTNGTDPLPNIPVSAFRSGIEQGNGISGSDGRFLIWGAGISVGNYEVVPQLESGENSSPSTHTVTLAAGGDMFVGTFTIVGAMGSITGAVTAGTAGITTGVLVYASTGTLSGSPLLPPVMNSVTRASSVIYYAVSSNAQGRYELPVRGGYTYNVYSWYTVWNDGTPVTTSRQTTAAVTAGESVTRDFSW